LPAQFAGGRGIVSWFLSANPEVVSNLGPVTNDSLYLVKVSLTRGIPKVCHVMLLGQGHCQAHKGQTWQSCPNDVEHLQFKVESQVVHKYLSKCISLCCVVLPQCTFSPHVSTNHVFRLMLPTHFAMFCCATLNRRGADLSLKLLSFVASS